MFSDKSHKIIKNETFIGEDFSGITGKHLTVINCSFESCCFDGLKVNEVCFGGGNNFSEFNTCTFNGAKFCSTAPGFARFQDCKFLNVKIQKFLCTTVDFIDCKFSGLIKGSIFNATPVGCKRPDKKTENMIVNNDFKASTLIDVSFRGGVDLKQQLLPTSEDCILLLEAEHKLRNMYSSVVTWADSDTRKKLLNLIKLLLFEVGEGQEDLFFGVSDFPKSQQNTALEFIKMLND